MRGALKVAQPSAGPRFTPRPFFVGRDKKGSPPSSLRSAPTRRAYVLAHKLREAMGADQDKGVAKGGVEIDGAYFGGYVKPANHEENRRDRRKAENQSGKRRVVVREQGGTRLRIAFSISG